MESVEYFDRPLTESGTIHPGETEVWFKDFVQDVLPSFFCRVVDDSCAFYHQKNYQRESNQA